MDAFLVDIWIKRILANEYLEGYPMKCYRLYNGVYQQYMFFYYRERTAASKQYMEYRLVLGDYLKWVPELLL